MALFEVIGMSWQDLVNGSFETFGGLAIMLHILQLHKDKQVRGVSWVAVGFFTGWGIWNLYYYPHLDQWASFAGGLIIAIANTVYVLQLLYYIRKDRTCAK